jgi:hypothetical protein
MYEWLENMIFKISRKRIHATAATEAKAIGTLTFCCEVLKILFKANYCSHALSSVVMSLNKYPHF